MKQLVVKDNKICLVIGEIQVKEFKVPTLTLREALVQYKQEIVYAVEKRLKECVNSLEAGFDYTVCDKQYLEYTVWYTDSTGKVRIFNWPTYNAMMDIVHNYDKFLSRGESLCLGLDQICKALPCGELRNKLQNALIELSMAHARGEEVTLMLDSVRIIK